MKIAYHWLQDYVNTSTPPAELGEKFLMTSSEIEDLRDWKEQLNHIVVGKIEDITPHPNADKLNLLQVNIGKDVVEIVSGAPNLEKGQHTLVALPGAMVFPLKGGEPFAISETVIRGISSKGMLCGAAEIGLPYTTESAFYFSNPIPPGTPASEALFLDDVVLDLEVTPNRPDLLSYLGMAREVATFEKRRLQSPTTISLDEYSSLPLPPVAVSIEDPKECLRYSGICFENVKITSSPLWLQGRLILSGIKPINTVVDITNYVMLELGQPLHAFDLERIEAPKNKESTLHVRRARKGENIDLLDGSRRSLPGGDIVISDYTGEAMDLAGIMGGGHHSISPNTTRVFLEAATFDGPKIRRTSRALGLRTEASTRFEKGLDPEMTVVAIKRAAHLLQEITGAKVSSSLLDIYPASNQIERPRISLSFSRIQQVLGVHISAAETKAILQKLGFQLPSLTKSSFEAIPPSWRRDVTLPEDIIEELIRIWGFDRLPATLPIGMVKAPSTNTFYEDKHTIRHTLASLGWHECLHLSFTSGQTLQKVGLQEKEAVPVLHPLSQETEFLLPSHLASLLPNIGSVNSRHLELALFEIGHVFRPPHEEIELLSLLMRTNKEPEFLYRSVKAAIHRIFRTLRLDGNEVEMKSGEGRAANYFEPGTVLKLIAQGKEIGEMGMLRSSLARDFKLRNGKSLLFAEINLDSLLALPKSHSPYLPPPVYPSIEPDITVVVNAKTTIGEIENTLRNYHHPDFLASWKVTTIYTGKPLPTEQKSVTIHFIYNHPERTLEDKEVQEEQKNLANHLRKKLNAQIND